MPFCYRQPLLENRPVAEQVAARPLPFLTPLNTTGWKYPRYPPDLSIVEFGLEPIPTLSTPGMQKKLLLPFRAQYRAIHQARLESKFVHGAFDAVASGAVQFRLANDAALAHLAFAH